MPCECLCVSDFRFVLDLLVILLHSLDGCNGCQELFFIRNNSRNLFQKELSYMHNL
jgi:hypothetical protein